MKSHIIRHYDDGELNEKVVYFSEHWENICNNIKSPDIDFDIMTPHYLCLELFDELEFNKLTNKENKQYYLHRLNSYFNADETIKGELKSLFRILRQELQNPRLLIIKKILNDVFRCCNTGTYYDNLISEVKSILLNDDSLAALKYKIQKMTKYTIIGLMIKGYSIDTIKDFIDSIFSKYDYYEGNLITHFPHKINYNEYLNNKELYYEKVKTLIDSLSIADRISKLYDYFNRDNEISFYIYHVNGIVGDRELTIGNVTFYNPYKKRYIKDNTWVKDEELRQDKTTLNAIVQETCLDIEQGKVMAIDDIEKSFDILRVHENPRARFEIDSGGCIVLDSSHEPIGQDLSVSTDRFSYYDSLRFEESFKDDLDKIQDIFKFVNDSHKLKNLLHYYRKASESRKNEDKILNYWIALETLSNNIDFKILLGANNETKIYYINEIVSHFVVIHYVFHYGWNVYYYMQHLLRNKFITLPQHIIQESGLSGGKYSEGTVIYLYKFLDKINDIIPFANGENEREKLIAINDFYFKNSHARNFLQTAFINLKNDILLLYRIRNKIVHDSFYTSKFLGYYSDKLKFITTSVITTIILEGTRDNKKSIDGIIIDKYLEYEKIKMNLEKDDIFILYQYVKEH